MRKYCHDHIGEATGYSKGWCDLCRAEGLLAAARARIAELEGELAREKEQCVLGAGVVALANTRLIAEVDALRAEVERLRHVIVADDQTKEIERLREALETTRHFIEVALQQPLHKQMFERCVAEIDAALAKPDDKAGG